MDEYSVPGDMVEDAIQRFAKQIGSEYVGLVKHAAESWAQPMMCIGNVQKKVARKGGRSIFGWHFIVRVNEEYGSYLLATHNAVWLCPEGTLLDVTPFNAEQKHRPITESGCILFLVDSNADPIEQAHSVLPLPSRFLALTDTPEMHSYLSNLALDEERQHRAILARDGNA